MHSSYFTALRQRMLPHAIFWFALWPLCSIVAAAALVREHPLTKKMSWSFALGGMSAGWWNLLPEYLATGLLLWMVSATLFSAVAHRRAATFTLRLVEPALMFVALSLGIAFEFPALLRHPALGQFRPLVVMDAYILIAALLVAFALAAGALHDRLRGAIGYAAAVIAVAAAGWGVTFLPAASSARQAGSNGVVLLGVDSLSRSDDVALLRHLAAQRAGTFYQRAVTPGLLTNAVWPAIIMHRPVRETGVLLTYQLPDWSRSPFHLVAEAEKQGFETWSFFSDQFTTHVGTLAGFDHDCSGPVGWLQMATFEVKNGSVLLPVLLSRLPPIPLARTPRNQASTYAYDLRAEMRELLTAGTGARPAFAAGHNDYLHQEAYPRFAELSPEEATNVRHAAIAAVQDFSLHWQYPSVPGDPIRLYPWKLRRIQQVIAEEIAATGFLDPQRKNRLVILSDHGNRAGLNNHNFGQPQYYGVLLVTFGVPARDPQAPISLVEIPALLGFADPSRPSAMDPVVEYASIDTEEEWTGAIVNSDMTSDGRVIFPPHIVSKWQRKLVAYRPYEAPAAYVPAPVNHSQQAQK